MSQIIRLRGSSALSAFRLDKLLQSAASFLPSISTLQAEFWHFVQLDRPLDADEGARLQRILTYGPAIAAGEPGGELLLVVPRFGTIAPWSSKATDVAHHCGLSAVRRIERGIAYCVITQDGA